MDKQAEATKQKVRDANKLLYEGIADSYEKIDGRRSSTMLSWLGQRIQDITSGLKGGITLLDVGCGSGIVIKATAGIAEKSYAIDISHNMLKTAAQFASGVVCADADSIPFKANSVNLVVLFAAMHHFYDFNNIIKEVHRVLETGGIVYIDHDINRAFVKRYGWALSLYRRLSRKKKKYLDAGVSKEVYDLSEFHSDGVDAAEIIGCLKNNGFSTLDIYYHWYGLSAFTDMIFRQKRFSENNAPLLGIVAKKV